jgi:hypothetical protein
MTRSLGAIKNGDSHGLDGCPWRNRLALFNLPLLSGDAPGMGDRVTFRVSRLRFKHRMKVIERGSALGVLLYRGQMIKLFLPR